MSFKVLLLGVTLAAYGLAQIPEKQSPDELTARELYYTEKPGDDTLPSLSAGTAGQGSRGRPKPKPKPKPPKDTSSTGSTKPKGTSSTRTSSNTDTSSPSRPDNVVNISEQRQPEPVEHLGLRYSLFLVQTRSSQPEAGRVVSRPLFINKQPEPVDPDRVFHTGECLALEVEPNRAGYLYVFAKSANGNYDPLFPSPQIQNESEVVSAHTKRMIPQHYCFELDEHTGEEDLYLIFSRNPEQASGLHDAVLKRNSGLDGGADAKISTKLIADAAQFNQEVTDTVAQLGSRGFDIQKVSAPGDGEPKYSVYVVVPAALEKKDIVYADIRINHQ